MTTPPCDDQTTDRTREGDRPATDGSLTPASLLAGAAVAGVALGLTNLLAALVLPYPLGHLGGSSLGWVVAALVVVYVVAPRVEPPHRELVRGIGLAVLVLALALVGLRVVGALVAVLGHAVALLDPSAILTGLG